MEELGILSQIKTNVLLRHFEPITLEEMKEFALQDRSETKFVMNTATFFEILMELSENYRVLEIGRKRKNAYQTLYFDSTDMEMYRNHHNGLLNRYKIRIREYLETSHCFFEIKFKDNKRKTIKKRISTQLVPLHINQKIHEFISENSRIMPDTLVPVLWNRYDRITMVSKNNIERVTFDMNLEFSDFHREKSAALPGIIIAEVKQKAFSNKSDLVKLMHKLSVPNEGFSKYCIGVASLFPDVKKNNFKRKLMLVNKLSGSIC